jgi:hypothetical protein
MGWRNTHDITVNPPADAERCRQHNGAGMRCINTSDHRRNLFVPVVHMFRERGQGGYPGENNRTR